MKSKKSLMLLPVLLVLLVPAAVAQQVGPVDTHSLSSVSPALERYTDRDLFGRVWQDTALSTRDRGLITMAALIARSQAEALPAYIGLALDNGVKPAEISETITHLAFYAGWQNAMSAADAATGVFERRGISVVQLPAADPKEMLPLDTKSEALRNAFVQNGFGSVSKGLVDNTAELLFRDLWLRLGLAPRDRSLVTVAALVAAGQVGQIGYHLNRAMDHGLTKSEASAVLSHLAFYAGWPSAFSALPVFRDVFANRK